jgi:hypothetical protein
VSKPTATSEQWLGEENENELVECAKSLDLDVESVRLFRALATVIINRRDADHLPPITIDQTIEALRSLWELHVDTRDYDRYRQTNPALTRH